MRENLWDAYGRWDSIANLNSINDVRRKITGNGAWRSNFVPWSLQYVFKYAVEEAFDSGIAEPSALDFGCGLGRNAPMLRNFFPKLIGFDLPEMAARFRSESPDVFALYSEVHASLAALKSENFCVLYDSVVLQHIVDRSHINEVMDAVLTNQSFRTFISVYNNQSSINSDNPPYPHLQLLGEKGWRLWHREIETLSFDGDPHAIAIFQRS